jgi:hypothetical protein
MTSDVANATYHHRQKTSERVRLSVRWPGSRGDEFYELHDSREAEPTQAHKEQIIADWRRVKRAVRDANFQADLVLANNEWSLD